MIARLFVAGCLLIALIAARPVPPPPDSGWLSQLEQPEPDPTSALPWLRPGGHF